jgi:spermidine/putrescine transport system ATP-binding protein
MRPEKVRVGAGEPNELRGTVAENAYVGVATQYVVDTPAGAVTVYVQNAAAGAAPLAPGSDTVLSWSPDCTFVIEEETT